LAQQQAAAEALAERVAAAKAAVRPVTKAEAETALELAQNTFHGSSNDRLVAIREAKRALREAVAAELSNPNLSGAAGPLSSPEKTLIDRLAASFAAMLAWIKDLGPLVERATVDADQSKHTGRIVESDDLHAVQKTSRRTYAIHVLDALDRVPPNGMEVNIKYQGGRGIVTSGEPDRGDRKGGVGR
jgi:hypothetical protein